MDLAIAGRVLVCCFSDEGGHYGQTRMILDELGVEDYHFNDILLLREVCMVVSRRSANLAAAGEWNGPERLEILVNALVVKQHYYTNV